MDFSQVARRLMEIDGAAVKAATAGLVELFRQAEPGEVGMLLALLRRKTGKVHPWLEELGSEDLWAPARLDPPHTLARVFAEVQRVARSSGESGRMRRQVLLASLGSDSAKVVERLLDGPDYVDARGLEKALTVAPWQPGLPILPEKLVRRTSEQVEAVWQSIRSGYGHVKDDGYYCQVHKEGEKVLLFVGVNLRDQTGLYPEVVAAVRQAVVAKNAILEGELVGLNPAGQVLPLTEMSRADRYQLRLFDLLGVDGEDWRNYPYRQRYEKRLSLVTLSPGAALDQALEFGLDSLAALAALFRWCEAEAWEGLVVKQVAATYLSGRSNPACVKIKSVEPVDAVIIGYDLDRTGEVGTFLLALYNEESEEFEACGRTQAGLSPSERRAVRAILAPRSGPAPAVAALPDPPNQWVEPQFVFEFRADSRNQSQRYPCARPQSGQGWVLHNPVFHSAEPRPDKEAHHTTSIEQFLSLRPEPGQISEPLGVTATPSPGRQMDFGW